MNLLTVMLQAQGGRLLFPHYDGSHLRNHVFLYDSSAEQEAEGNTEVPQRS